MNGGGVVTTSDELLRASSSDEARSSAKLADVYVPVNEIKEEVYAMLAAWESHALQSPDVAAREPYFEPFRCLSDAGPPKRFYRTFWRGVTRKLVRKHLDMFMDVEK